MAESRSDHNRIEVGGIIFGQILGATQQVFSEAQPSGRIALASLLRSLLCVTVALPGEEMGIPEPWHNL